MKNQTSTLHRGISTSAKAGAGPEAGFGHQPQIPENNLRLWPRNPALVNGGPDSPRIEKRIELKNQNYE
jgi:hypothetical protein